MNTFSEGFEVTSATADTLADLYALHPDREDAARRLEARRERLATGHVRFDQLLILRGPRGVEGTLLLAGHPAVPLFPRLRPEAPVPAVTALLRSARAQVSPERSLLLDSTLAPLGAEPARAAGWAHTATHVLYETDLRARTFAPDPDAREASAQEVSADDPAVRALLAELGRADWQPDGDEVLVALFGEGAEPLALGTVQASGRPDAATLDLIGVRPGRRGQGHGARLHAHLLARAAEDFGWHFGATDADNLAMRRILARHGARETAVQEVYLPLVPQPPERV
ncbi:GNAT family N-acetyltransferase [Deinococcus petrolearius]|uniref:GNAT family N-acetyltransferase n=1 Tax=Deinococcus petrolearius TaxID=1751295 RepID=A0ABW1DRD7_9DEIO